jgi:hypothetical protein
MAARWVALLALASLTLAAASPASAVIINNLNGLGNDSAPDGDCGWSYTGITYNGCSCVYVGNRWVLTGYHVGAQSVFLGGNWYSAVAGSSHRLSATGGSNTTIDADLVMFQLTATPTGLGTLSIASGTYSTSDVLTAIGHGSNRATDPTYWDSDWNTTGSATAVYTGYAWASGLTRRWGTNTLSTTTAFLEDTTQTYCLGTIFDANGGDNEMQAANGDSGGGVFVQDSGGDWTLAGIMLSIGYVDGDNPKRPGTAAVYDDATYFADLRCYREQIEAVRAVPEPGTLALLAIGAAAWLLWRRRRD